MNISGWAFTTNADELSKANIDRYNEIKHLKEDLEMVKQSAYGKGVFSGKLTTEETKQLSPKDLALIADQGNLCFGGYCTISGNTFSGAYYTD